LDSFKWSIVWIGVAIMTGMILCPPWMRITPGLPTKAVGYSLLWNPPQVMYAAETEPVAPKKEAPVLGVAPPPVPQVVASGPPSYAIDIMRLLSQLGLTIMVGGMAVFVIQPRAGKNYGTLRKQVKHNLR
jgi:hypothetical protein